LESIREKLGFPITKGWTGASTFPSVISDNFPPWSSAVVGQGHLGVTSLGLSVWFLGRGPVLPQGHREGL
jgi:hypothetical protein